ncbi:DNA-directed RNA polymerase subunit P [Candidatus Woesearchaeota archaeon]|nr:DNA-directed RNA polymerase subunit P [Candidatus Woesearchaeota archaeon]
MSYTCFYCRKEVPDELRGKKIRCPYCGNKVLIKERGVTTKVSAR